jgi:hypothetical protein
MSLSSRIAGTIKDAWNKLHMLKQIPAKDTRMAFADVMVAYIYLRECPY